MFQKEFAERLIAPVGAKTYGSLSVFAQLRAKIRILDIVPKGCFSPVPKVDSALIILESRDNSVTTEQSRKIETLCKAAFSKRRKKMSNAIKPFLGPEIKDFPFDLDLRPERFKPEEYLAMARILFPKHF